MSISIVSLRGGGEEYTWRGRQSTKELFQSPCQSRGQIINYSSTQGKSLAYGALRLDRIVLAPRMMKAALSWSSEWDGWEVGNWQEGTYSSRSVTEEKADERFLLFQLIGDSGELGSCSQPRRSWVCSILITCCYTLCLSRTTREVKGERFSKGHDKSAHTFSGELPFYEVTKLTNSYSTRKQHTEKANNLPAVRLLCEIYMMCTAKFVRVIRYFLVK